MTPAGPNNGAAVQLLCPVPHICTTPVFGICPFIEHVVHLQTCPGARTVHYTWPRASCVTLCWMLCVCRAASHLMSLCPSFFMAQIVNSETDINCPREGCCTVEASNLHFIYLIVLH